MAYYKQHLFFCINLKDNGGRCCQMGDAKNLAVYAKKRLKALDLHGAGGVRVSTSGCLGRCGCGPNVVIYPEGIWYHYRNQFDIDQIIDEHIVQGKMIDRLLTNIEA